MHLYKQVPTLTCLFEIVITETWRFPPFPDDDIGTHICVLLRNKHTLLLLENAIHEFGLINKYKKKKKKQSGGDDDGGDDDDDGKKKKKKIKRRRRRCVCVCVCVCVFCVCV